MTIRDQQSVNALGRPLPAKVCHRAHSDIEVAQGNHSISRPGFQIAVARAPITIFHFPMRSYRQFANKIALGGAAYARNTELPLSIGDISSAANGAVSLDGDGTSQLHIHLAGEASSSGTLAPQRSNTTDATTSVYMYLVINLNGLVPAQSYQIRADWSYSTDAAGPNSGFGAISGGHLGTSFEDFSVGPMTTVFERTISGNTGQPPAHGMDSGSTTIDFVPTASSEELDLILTATCTVDLSGHTGNFDMSDATFSGDATLTIVPEPSSLALLSLGTLCLCLFLLLGTRRLQALLGRRWVLEESSVRRI